MSFLLSGEEILQALADLAGIAAEAGVNAGIYVVGGAAIELAIGDRGATRDIDAFILNVGVLDDFVARLAAERGWPSDWLNDKASQFASDYDDLRTWPVVLEVGTVTVRVAPLGVLVAMKLRAGRGIRDFSDLDLLLDRLGWDRALTEACFERFYPHDVLKPAAVRYLNARFR